MTYFGYDESGYGIELDFSEVRYPVLLTVVEAMDLYKDLQTYLGPDAIKEANRG